MASSARSFLFLRESKNLVAGWSHSSRNVHQKDFAGTVKNKTLSLVLHERINVSSKQTDCIRKKHHSKNE